MSNLPLKKTLEAEGTYAYLQRTLERHNGYDRKLLISDMTAGVSIAKSARKAKVTDKTMRGWRILVGQELQNEREQLNLVRKEF